MAEQDGSRPQLEALVNAIRSPIKGESLPKLEDLEGASIFIRVENGKLNWAALGPGQGMGCW